MLAVIDETVPFVGGGVCYGVMSGVLLGDESKALATLERVIPVGRRRPFHWCFEGIAAKTAMIAALADVGVLARAVVVPCGRRRQEAARAVAMAATVEHLVDDDCDELVVEARTPAQDGRDQLTILDVVRPRNAQMRVTWAPKTNKLLWIADAIGGAVHEHLTGAESDWYKEVTSICGLALEYRYLTTN